MAAADSAMPGGPGKEMDISKVNPQQLQQLHQSLEQEIQNLNVSFQTLQTVNAKFKESEMAVDKMSQCSGTSQVLVPLTSSMYVPGEIEDKDKLLVDIGAAYYAEKDCKGATKYLQRKQVSVNENIEKVGKLMNSKKLQLQVVTMELQKRMAAIMEAQQQQAKS